MTHDLKMECQLKKNPARKCLASFRKRAPLVAKQKRDGWEENTLQARYSIFRGLRYSVRNTPTRHFCSTAVQLPYLTVILSVVLKNENNGRKGACSMPCRSADLLPGAEFGGTV